MENQGNTTQGHWVWDDEDIHCSCCKEQLTTFIPNTQYAKYLMDRYKFCFNCGARMQ